MSKISLSGMFRHKGSYSALIYSLVALLLLLLQCAPHGFPTLFHVRPAPLVPFVVCVAILEGARAGVMIGTFSGLLWGIYSFRLFGLDALLLMALGLAAGLLVEWLLRANFLSALLLCSAGILVQALLEWLLCYPLLGKPQAAAVLLQAYLPACLYTMLLIPPIYFLVLFLARRIRRRVRD